MSLYDEEVCPACSGTGRHFGCEHCDGSGHVVRCLNSDRDNRSCRGEMPAPEAETEGAYCRSCRRWLDQPEAAE